MGIYSYIIFRLLVKRKRLLVAGQVSVKSLVTHRFPLEHVNEAFKMARTKECMKVMIVCNKD
jgi:threonine dehydrogenase-like Zn-dependent dehydrogenase